MSMKDILEKKFDLEAECEDCGHPIKAHGEHGCVASIPDGTVARKPCGCEAHEIYEEQVSTERDYNPFEPPETKEQQDRRIRDQIRENYHARQVSTEPQGPARAGQEPGETGGSQDTVAQSVRPSWLFPFPMELTDGRRPDAQRDGGVREGDFFEGLRSKPC
jgi:hypothetical protein